MQRMVIARERCNGASTGREAIIYRQLEIALTSRGTVVERNVDPLVERHRNAPFGLERIRPLDSLVAFGRAAHVGLADFEKRTLFAADLDLDTEPVDIERLVWSSVNTTRAVALGDAAWRSLQLLPIEAIRVHPTPPLVMTRTSGALCKSSVRIISHGRRPQATAAAALLSRAGFAVVAPSEGWCDDAAIHLHIGRHDIEAIEPRLVDSWASGRLAIQIDDSRSEATAPRQPLRVEHERNGLVCRAIGDVVTACEDIRADEIFWGKLVKAGHKTVAHLLKGWADVADEIFA